MPERAGLKRSKESQHLAICAQNIHAKLQMPTKVNLRNDVIARRVRTCPFKVKSFCHNLLIYENSILFVFKFPLTCIKVEKQARMITWITECVKV